MRGTKAKRIRRQTLGTGYSSRARTYFRQGGVGQIKADPRRHAYQQAKKAER